MQITPQVHRIPGVTANCYLIVERFGLTLIDTGIPGSAGLILDYLLRCGHSPRSLKHILITHADYDHAGSLAALQRLSGARTYASLAEARAMAAGRFPRSLRAGHALLRPVFSLAERFGRIAPVEVEEVVTDGQRLPILGGLQVVTSGGHTPGHISLFAPAEGLLFSGDSILSAKGRLVGSRGAVTWDQAQADRSVLRQAALRPSIVCAGHGPVVRDAQTKFPPHAEGFPAQAAFQRL